MKIKGKTVCVTGASGFLGTHLCRRLIAEGARVIAIDNFSVGNRKNIEALKGDIEILNADIRSLESIKEPLSKSQIVYHLAAIANPRTCRSDFSLAFDINVKGTENILSVCSGVGKLVFLSTIMVYGAPKYLPIDDRHPLDAHDPYALSKIMGEYLLKAHDNIRKLPFIIIRNANSFGPYQDPSYLIPTLIIQGMTKKEIEIWDPYVIRDFLYVDDTIEALIRVVEAETTAGEIINLGSGQGISSGELADMVCSMLKAKWFDAKKPAPVSSKLIADISKIKALTGWQPKVELEEGIRKTIEYFEAAKLS